MSLLNCQLLNEIIHIGKQSVAQTVYVQWFSHVLGGLPLRPHIARCGVACVDSVLVDFTAVTACGSL